LEFPELIDRIRLLVLQFPDFIVVGVVLVGACQTTELCFDRCYLALLDSGVSQLLQRLHGQVLKHDAVLPLALAERLRRHVKRNAGHVLDGRKRLEFCRRRNVDVQPSGSDA